MEDKRPQSIKGPAIQAAEEIADEEERTIEEYDSCLEARAFQERRLLINVYKRCYSSSFLENLQG